MPMLRRDTGVGFFQTTSGNLAMGLWHPLRQWCTRSPTVASHEIGRCVKIRNSVSEAIVVRSLMALLVDLAGLTIAVAQPQQSVPAQTSQAPYVAQYEGRITVRADRTATDIFTQRLRIQKR